MTIHQTEVSRSKHVFKKSTLAVCIAALTAAQAYGQENTTTEDPVALEEVLVYGVKQSLQNAQDIKRDSDTVVDAISASDIGSLPDRSVLEALQRVPGVSIERFAAADDPDHFSVEGSGVVIRGLTQTRSEFNGRDTFTANAGRGLSFQDVPPELMGSVEVAKNQSADMIEGGISGTVNLKTRLPLDNPERLIAFSAEALYSDLIEETTPAGSALYSDAWTTGAGTFGFLANLAASNIKARTDGVQIERYVTRNNIGPNGERLEMPGTTTYEVPRGANVRTAEHDRDRFGGSLAFQWENPDETMLLTTQIIHSDSTNSWVEHVVEFQDGDREAQLFAAGFQGANPFTFDGNGRFQSGTIAAYDMDSRYFQDVDVGGGRTPENGGLWGSKYALQTRFSENTNKVTDYSAHLRLNPGDRWTLDLDAQYIDSSVTNTDFSVMNATHALVDLDLNGGDMPSVRYLNPYTGLSNEDAGVEHPIEYSTLGDQDYFSASHNTYWRSAMDHTEDSEGDEFALQADVDYEVNNFGLTTIESGVRYAKRSQTTRWAIYNWSELSESWTSWGNEVSRGPAWMDRADVAHLIDDQETYSFDNFHRGDGLAGADTFRFPSVDYVRNYRALDALGFHWNDPNYADQVAAVSVPGQVWSPLSARDGLVDGRYQPAEINESEEANTAIYAKANFEWEGGIRIGGNVGVRLVRIENDTTGYQIFPDLAPNEIQTQEEANNINQQYVDAGFENPGLMIGDPNPLDRNNFLPESDRAFGNEATYKQEAANDYFEMLPSLNLKFELTDDVLIRLAVSKAIAQPELGKLRNYMNVEAQDVTGTVTIGDDGIPVANTAVGYYQASAGNPNLKPMEAIQYDLSAEWYFADVGSLTATIFYKDLKNYFIDGAFNRQISNNGATKTVRVDGPINGGEGSIEGFEIAYQQFYDFLPEPWDGIGTQFNYTYVENEGSPNSGLSNYEKGPDDTASDIAFTGLPLQGLSKDTYNVALMYQKEAIELRLAYNWRSDYLLTTRDVITTLPIYNKASGNLDASAFYDLNDSFKIGIQITNLLDEVTETEMQVNQEGDRVGRSWFVNDRKFALTLRGSF